MKKKWIKIMAVCCAAVMFMTMPGMSVLADEMPEEESIRLDTAEELIGASEFQFGDGVTGTFDPDTGALEFTSQDGMLDEDWSFELYIDGVDPDKITSIKVVEGTVYLPAESAYFFSFSNLANLDLRGFNTENVEDMYGMFYECDKLTDLDLSGFDTSNVTDMCGMFYGCSSLTELDLSSFNTESVEDMYGMFYGCGSLTNLDLSSFKTPNVKDMSGMFYGCHSLTSLDLSGFVTSKVEDMAGMFYECGSLTSLDLSNFNTSNVTRMGLMFSKCASLTDLDVHSFDTSNVTGMANMFQECASLTHLDLNNFDTQNVTDMYAMFYGCSSLTDLDLGSFDTQSVTDTTYMFGKCDSLTNLDLSGFDTSNVTEYPNMFTDCLNLQTLKTPKKNSLPIALPITMYDEAANEYTELPETTESIVLRREILTPTPTPTASGFSDVQDPSHAYYKAIYWAADAGITKGYPDGTFGIDKPCTRGEMMMFLWRYAGKPAPKNTSKSPFKDVKTNHAFYKAILWGSQKGITKGYDDGTFGIDRNVTRGEAMMFLWRLKGKPAPKAAAKSPFKDVPTNHVFYKAILWGSQKKVTTGYTSGVNKGKFMVNANCTRGQIVTFLYRAK